MPGTEQIFRPNVSKSGGSNVSSGSKENHRYGHHHDPVEKMYIRPPHSPHGRSPHHSYFPGFADEFFHHTPFSKSFDEWMPVFNNLERGENNIIHHSSPGYEINENENDYQIAIDVPGVHLHDLNLQLENYGHVLHVQGKREIHREGKLVNSKFEKRFRIGHNIDHDSITAHLSEGVLVVTAPKLKKLMKKPKDIFIHNGDEP